jgi:DNA-binding MarR family transcriptional regulator
MMYIHHMIHKPSAESAQISVQAILEVCLCHHARRTARAITRIFDEALAPTGLKANQFTMLAAIGAGDGGSTAAIARLLALDRTTLSRNLKPLRQLGYLTSGGGAGRRPDTVDLTPTGRQLLNEATPLWQQAQGALTQRLGTGHSGALLQNLEATARMLR